MDDAQLADAGTVQALQRTNPQVDIGIHRILHQDGNVRSLQGIGEFLHQEGIGGGTRPDPQIIQPIFQALIDVLGAGHFGTHLHTQLFLDAFHPAQAFCAHSFKGTRMGTRFPDTGPEDMDALAGEPRGRCHHLFFGFGAARAGNHHRPRQRKKSPVRNRDQFPILCHYRIIFLMRLASSISSRTLGSSYSSRAWRNAFSLSR